MFFVRPSVRTSVVREMFNKQGREMSIKCDQFRYKVLRDGRTDGPTGTLSRRDAGTHLKMRRMYSNSKSIVRKRCFSIESRNSRCFVIVLSRFVLIVFTNVNLLFYIKLLRCLFSPRLETSLLLISAVSLF